MFERKHKDKNHPLFLLNDTYNLLSDLYLNLKLLNNCPACAMHQIGTL